MTPQEAAEILLVNAWENDKFPVDPVHLAKHLGISVVTMELPNNVSGALIKEQDNDPVIVLSQNDSVNRWRFSCAHELGHYVDRTVHNGDHYEYIDLRSELSSQGSNKEEVFANQFAANLLMPEEAVRKTHQSMPVFLLAQHFGVSDDAMNFRLKTLSLKR